MADGRPGRRAGNCKATALANRQGVYRHLSQWLTDPDLVSVRDRQALEALPVDERVGWVKLWTEIRELRDATAPPPAAPPPREVKR